MDPQQFAQLIDAVKNAAAHAHSPYDYLVLALPVLTGVAGWVASAIWQTRQFKRQNAKEHYLLIRTKAETVVADYNALLELTREFFTTCRNLINLGTTLTEDTINDFITRFQLQLSMIHQTQKLMFPGRSFATKAIAVESDRLVASVQRMNTLRQRFQVLAAQPSPNRNEGMQAMLDDFAAINKQNEDIFAALSRSIAVVENEIIALINQQAKKLGIS